jgi:hypothetical protein
MAALSTPEGARRMPRWDLLEGLTREWDTDAHVFPYDVVHVGTGRVCAHAPRVNDGGVEVLRGLGYELRYSSLWYDLDAPDHGGAGGVDEYVQRTLAAALPLAPALWYQGRGGLRLIYPLAEPVGPEDYTRLWLAWREHLQRAGVEVDRATRDRGRCYRLPYVVRDGVPLRYPASLEPIEPWSPERVAGLLAEREAIEAADRRLRQRRTAERTALGIGLGYTGILEAVQRGGLLRRHIDARRVAIICPWEHEHTRPAGVGDTSTVLLGTADGGWIYHCSHSHCAHRTTRDLREALGADAIDVRPVRVEVSREETPSPERPPIDLDGARAQLAHTVREAIATGGDHTVICPTGVGKTHAALDEALILAETTGQTVYYAVPTRELRREVQQRAMARRSAVGAEHVWCTEQLGREPGVCYWPEQVAALHVAGGQEAVRAYCATCPDRDDCRFYGQFTGARLRTAARLVVLTHASLYLDGGTSPDRELAAVIVDESPLAGASLATVSATAQQVAEATWSGAVRCDDDALGRLGRLIVATRTASSDALREALGAGSYEADGVAARAALEARLHGAARDQLDTILADAPDHRLAQALAQASATAWTGAYVYDGRVHLGAVARALPSADVRIYLDATGDEAQARAVLPGCTVHRIGAPTDLSHVRLVRYDWGAGRRNIERRPELWAAVHAAYDSPTTVHWTHRRLALEHESILAPPHNWIASAEGRVDYFGSPRTRGYDGDRGADTVVIDSWHVPRAAIVSLAERLEAEGAAESYAEALVAARRRLEWAQVEQIVGRLRILTRRDPITVVMIAHAPHTGSPQLPAAEERGDLGVRLWERYGAMTAEHGPGALLEYLGERLARSGSILLGEDIEPAPYADDTASAQLRTCTVAHAIATLYPGGQGDLVAALEDHIGQPVAHVEMAWGVEHATYTRGALTLVDDDHAALVAATQRAEAAGAWWIRAGGAAWMTRHHPIARAAARMGTAPTTIAELARESGRHPSTVSRALARLGLDVADLHTAGAEAVVAACAAIADEVRTPRQRALARELEARPPPQ